MSEPGDKNIVDKTPKLAIAALVFGLLTVVSGASVLFGPASVRQAAGEVVAFVLWFNFLAGFFYIVAAVDLWQGRARVVKLAGLIALLSALVLVAMGIYITGGSEFETRTPVAMSFRCVFWLGVYLYMRRRVKQNYQETGES